MSNTSSVTLEQKNNSDTQNNDAVSPPTIAKPHVSCRTCQNCGHRMHSIYDLSKCMLSGFYCTTERRYPTVCGVDFKGWIPRPKSKGIIGWLRSLWYGS